MLERDGGNLKALYRRAQAYMATADYVEAEQDIRKGLIEVRSCGHPARVGHRLVADVREAGRRAAAALAARSAGLGTAPRLAHARPRRYPGLDVELPRRHSSLTGQLLCIYVPRRSCYSCSGASCRCPTLQDSTSADFKLLLKKLKAAETAAVKKERGLFAGMMKGLSSGGSKADKAAAAETQAPAAGAQENATANVDATPEPMERA